MGIGADIQVRAAVSDEFAITSGRYFDTGPGGCAPPHPDALDPQKNVALVHVIETILGELT